MRFAAATQRRTAIGYGLVFLLVTGAVPVLTLVLPWWSEARLAGGLSPNFLVAAVGLYVFFVLLGSAENVVVGNTVRGNRVGIRVNNLDSVGNTISTNRIEGNSIGVQAYGGASDLEITDNSIVNSADTALILDAPRTVVRGDDVRGA
ncbi:MAG: right-handed parallel beta-helix repeat-containing protein, partial [Proteobacteria bacterium]|nr:right-handed parallel beta-helix repeat-containing protein [Pseudomonadota bacterium]